MKFHWGRGVFISLLAVATIAVAQQPNVPKVVPVKPNAAFERMKSLVGEWEGANSVSAARVSYRLTSGGTVLLEMLVEKDTDGKDVEMMTAYYLDGDKLAMTHFCAGNSQPRMIAASATGDEISFKFKDVTNLPAADYGHMRALTVRFIDADHITQAWTWRENGKDQKAEVFQFTRKR